MDIVLAAKGAYIAVNYRVKFGILFLATPTQTSNNSNDARCQGFGLTYHLDFLPYLRNKSELAESAQK